MSTIIAGSDDTAVTITRYSRGRNAGYGYQVTWRTDSGQISYLSFDSEAKARELYHLVYLSLEVS